MISLLLLSQLAVFNTSSEISGSYKNVKILLP